MWHNSRLKHRSDARVMFKDIGLLKVLSLSFTFHLILVVAFLPVYCHLSIFSKSNHHSRMFSLSLSLPKANQRLIDFNILISTMSL